MQLLQAAEDVRRRVLVTAGVRGAVPGLRDRDVGHAIEEAFEADAGLGTRQRRARARVRAVPEGQVLPSIRAVDTELPGIVEPARITVRGTVEHHQRGARRDVDAADRRRDA